MGVCEKDIIVELPRFRRLASQPTDPDPEKENDMESDVDCDSTRETADSDFSPPSSPSVGSCMRLGASEYERVWPRCAVDPVTLGGWSWSWSAVDGLGLGDDDSIADVAGAGSETA